MSGTTRDIIPIVIVPVVALVVWLIVMYHAASHPRWGSQAPADTVSGHALEGSDPAQHLSSSGTVVPGQRPGTAADEAAPQQVRASETRRE
jgi:hypothetical protein